ncbi:MAG: hypothetical protein GEV08_13390, partial [Acidimicrobiia bacterium]|nr:hypothetical protein [Acidimicrobiia bacterium]
MRVAPVALLSGGDPHTAAWLGRPTARVTHAHPSTGPQFRPPPSPWRRTPRKPSTPSGSSGSSAPWPTRPCSSPSCGPSSTSSTPRTRAWWRAASAPGSPRRKRLPPRS